MLIIAKTLEVAIHHHNALHPIIGDTVQVDAITVDQLPSIPIDKPDAVLLSAKFLMAHDLASRFPATPILHAEHMITGQNVEQLLMLPPGLNAAVVASHRDVELEVISNLRAQGIDQLRYVVHSNGEYDPQDMDLAITPGMPFNVPPAIAHIVNLGLRVMTIYSFQKLLEALGMASSYIERYAHMYTSTLLQSRWELAKVIHSSTAREKTATRVLNELDSGIIAVNESGAIRSANTAAQQLFQQQAGNFLGESLDSFMRNLKEVRVVDDNPDKRTILYHFNGEYLLGTRLSVENDGNQEGILIFKRAGLAGDEPSLRKNWHIHGHTARYTLDDIFSDNLAVQELIDKLPQFALSDRNILIMGESGTGKELFAHAIHNESARKNGPFVAANFAGISHNLWESELFGYEEGAFTGAARGGKKGLFELADGGSIFLDEIGDSTPDMQARLLRVLQEKQIIRVGGSKVLTVNARVIAATNTNLPRAISDGRFRHDLFYRLSTLTIRIPPLRERPEDIGMLLRQYLRRMHNTHKDISPDAKRALLAYAWAGNIRELFNVAEYCYYSAMGSSVINASHLPPEISLGEPPAEEDHPFSPSQLQEKLAEITRMGLHARQVHTVLSALSEYSAGNVGRYKLRAMLNNAISDGRLRSILEKLNKAGIVQSGSTRQGTVLTVPGDAFRLFLGTTLR